MTEVGENTSDVVNNGDAFVSSQTDATVVSDALNQHPDFDFVSANPDNLDSLNLPSLTDDDIVRLWGSMNGEDELAARTAFEEAFRHSFGIVLHVADKHKSRFLDFDECVTAGSIGLMDAIRRFNLEQAQDRVREIPSALGLTNVFRAYAFLRVRGEVVDEQRRVSVHAPSVARRLNGSRDKLFNGEDSTYAVAVQMTDATSLEADAVGWYGDNPVPWKDVLVAKDDTELEVIESERALQEQVASLLDDVLNDRDREIVKLSVFDGLTYDEIGKVFGVTESRICQIIVQARHKLRRAAVRRDMAPRTYTPQVDL